MTRVAISREVLDWALSRLADIEPVEKRFPKLQQWLSGEQSPTMNQLENFARATYTPLGFFFLDKPPEVKLPIPFYRTHAGKNPKQPSPNLIETVEAMEQRQAWLHEYLAQQGEEPLSFVGSASEKDDLKHVAESMRQVLDLPAAWASQRGTWTEALTYLKQKVEASGVMVVTNGVVGNNTHRKLDPTEFRGFVLIDRFAPLIFINGADSKAAQMFTAAHELVHVWLGRSAAFDFRDMEPANDEVEQFCDKVAAEFLVPENLMKEVWKMAKSNPAPFESVARHFKVSQLVAARRALDSGLVTKSQFFAFYRDYAEREKDKPAQPGGDFYANQNGRVGRRFAQTVVQAAREGKLLYREAYQLTGLHGETFERFANSL
jgi:Zn-dependent peptidase ImmA (M78 family)